ncbi:MAG: hypothetical protein P8Y64_13230 [Gammaproteobacteria bacterium]|jgi:hypothetical protein
MILSASAFGTIVTVALAVTVLAPLILIALFIIDWRRKRLW